MGSMYGLPYPTLTWIQIITVSCSPSPVPSYGLTQEANNFTGNTSSRFLSNFTSTRPLHWLHCCLTLITPSCYLAGHRTPSWSKVLNKHYCTWRCQCKQSFRLDRLQSSWYVRQRVMTFNWSMSLFHYAAPKFKQKYAVVKLMAPESFSFL